MQRAKPQVRGHFAPFLLTLSPKNPCCCGSAFGASCCLICRPICRPISRAGIRRPPQRPEDTGGTSRSLVISCYAHCIIVVRQARDEVVLGARCSVTRTRLNSCADVRSEPSGSCRWRLRASHVLRMGRLRLLSLAVLGNWSDPRSGGRYLDCFGFAADRPTLRYVPHFCLVRWRHHGVSHSSHPVQRPDAQHRSGRCLSAVTFWCALGLGAKWRLRNRSSGHVRGRRLCRAPRRERPSRISTSCCLTSASSRKRRPCTVFSGCN